MRWTMITIKDVDYLVKRKIRKTKTVKVIEQRDWKNGIAYLMDGDLTDMLKLAASLAVHPHYAHGDITPFEDNNLLCQEEN